MRRFLTSRRVLSASLGVATASYIACSSACGGGEESVGNLMASDFPPAAADEDAATPPRLTLPDASGDAEAGDATTDAADTRDAADPRDADTWDAADADDARSLEDAEPGDAPSDV